MDSPSSPREKGDGFWVSPRCHAHGSPFLDGGIESSISEDPLDNISWLIDSDTYATDQLLTSDGLSSVSSVPYDSLDAPNFLEQASSDFPDSGFSAMGTSLSCGDKVAIQQMSAQFGFSTDCTEADQQNTAPDMWSSGSCMLSQPIGLSLAEKMFTALSMFKESCGGGILAQVWVPMKVGEQYVLSTYKQPYLPDQMLSGYHEVSQNYTFSTEVNPGSFPGLPGRVFKSRVPEWTSNIGYYNNTEYLRVNHAVDHDVHGSIALPVFDSHDSSCCAVLELVTTKEKPNFDPEIENVCHALQAVNLRSSAPPRLHSQCFSRNQKSALAEIADVLRAVCHAHRLPLALTWIPCNYTGSDADDTIEVRVREGDTNSAEKCILCIEDTACYVNDREMQGFVHACAEHYLEEDQGVAGKALQSNYPFFFPDVKTYDINEYPLVHHARKFGLNAAVAIRLKSTFTGNDDYILELFLPVNMKGRSEQQLLLNNLSGTMQRLCKNLRTVSGAELVGTEVSSIEVQKGVVPNFSPIAMLGKNSQTVLSDNDLNFSDMTRGDVMEAYRPHEQAIYESRKQLEKKRSTSEKKVSLSVLQQYFSGSLKDAAKCIGVCPTTLKRICRQHGISRWPSRKINKVNRSLKKIQTVLDSVQGVDRGLKFDPVTGGFVSVGSIVQESDAQRNPIFSERDLSSVRNHEAVNQDFVPSAPSIDGRNITIKLEENEGFGFIDSRTLQVVNTGEGEEEPKPSLDSYGEEWGLNNGSFKLENSDYHSDEMELGADGGIIEHNQSTASVMTDSSNGSGSMIHGSSSSSQSFEEQRQSKVMTTSSENNSIITVKATHKEDTVRFKFEPSLGCFQLYEEVAKRFKLQNGTFQLKYMDDEEEWVMLVSDSDLQECVEILELVGKNSVKFLVREMASAMGSSSGSSCFLVAGS